MIEIKNKKQGMKKGQVTIVDFALSMFIFTILVMVIVVTLYDYHERINNRLEEERILSTALEITDVFVKSPGVPINWNNDTVKMIGLAYVERRISENKLGEFCENLTYEEARQVMNLIYEFHFSLTSPDDSFEEIECGRKPEDAMRIVALKRSVIYKDEIALLKFSLWR